MTEGGSSGTRVLVVDDDPMLRRLFTRSLLKLGATGTVVDSGDAARVAVTNDTFELVLIDQHLGHEIGSDLVVELRQMARGTPRWICISGSLLAGDPAPEGFDGAEEKPATLDAMRALLERWIP